MTVDGRNFASKAYVDTAITTVQAEIDDIHSDVDPMMRDLFFPEKYGCDGTGASGVDTGWADMLGDIRSNGGGHIYAAGQYRFDTSGWNLPSFTWLEIPYPTSKLIKNFTTGGSGPQAFIRSGNGVLNSGDTAQHIAISGLGTIGATDLTKRGNIFGFRCDDATFKDFTVNVWTGGRMMYGAGNRWRGYNVKSFNSSGNTGDGGWRYCGGNDSTFVGFHIESGDDALQMVPGAGHTDPLFNIDIQRCRYIGCTGRSVSARFMALALQATNGDAYGLMTNNIIDSGWEVCHGFGNVRGLIIMNNSSTGTVDNIYVNESSSDCIAAQAFSIDSLTITSGSPIVTGFQNSSNGGTGLIEANQPVSGLNIPGGGRVLSVDSSDQVTLTVNATATVTGTETLTFNGIASSTTVFRGATVFGGVGPMSNISFYRYHCKNPVGTKNAMAVTGGAIQNLSMEKCRVDASPNQTVSLVDLQFVDGLRVTGGEYDLGGLTAMPVGLRIGSSPDPGADCVVEGARIKNIANGIYGVKYDNVTGGELTETKFEPFAGATTPKTFDLTSLTTGMKVYNNNFVEMPNNPNTWLDQTVDGAWIYGNLGDSTVQGTPWSTAGGFSPVFVLLGSDFDFTNTSSMQQITGLQVPVVSGGTYRVNYFFAMYGDSAEDIKMNIVSPVGSTWELAAWDGLNTSAANVASGRNMPVETSKATPTSSQNFALLGGTTASYVRFTGILLAGNSNNITPQCQQNTAPSAVTSHILAESYGEVLRIS